jgi:hypothetical protein
MKDEDGFILLPSDFIPSPVGPLAQLVEQLTLNQRVRSSSLRRPTIFSAIFSVLPASLSQAPRPFPFCVRIPGSSAIVASLCILEAGRSISLCRATRFHRRPMHRQHSFRFRSYSTRIPQLDLA